MPQIRQVKFNGEQSHIPAAFFSFDLLEVEQYIREASQAFRAIRSSGVNHKIWDVGFTFVKLDSFSFLDANGNPVTIPPDSFSWESPELRIKIPKQDDCFVLHFIWMNEGNEGMVEALYSFTRSEATDLFRNAKKGNGWQ